MKYRDPVNRLGEFDDADTEELFFNAYMQSSKRLTRSLILLSGVVFSLLFLFDHLLPEEPGLRWLSFFVRSVVLVSAIITCAMIQSENRGRIAAVYITIYELIMSTGIISLVYYLEPDNLIKHGMIVILCVMFCFNVTNRWVFQLFFAATMIAQYLFVIHSAGQRLDNAFHIETISYLLLALLISGSHAYRIHYYRRTQFVREDQLRVTSVTDRLTRIYNRQKFDEVFQHWIRVSEDTSETFSLIMFDLDNYKHFNDTFGHLAGDTALVSVTRLVKGNIRSHDIFARWGGEEFMILLPFTPLVHAADLADRLRIKIGSFPMDTGGTLTASFGVTEFRKGDTQDVIIQRVDAMMYKAKKQGKNCVIYDL